MVKLTKNERNDSRARESEKSDPEIKIKYYNKRAGLDGHVFLVK